LPGLRLGTGPVVLGIGIMNGPVAVKCSREELLEQLKPHGQEHLLAFWDTLSADQQASLASQIAAIDYQALAALRSQYGGGKGQTEASGTYWAELAARAESPPAVRLDGSGLPC